MSLCSRAASLLFSFHVCVAAFFACFDMVPRRSGLVEPDLDVWWNVVNLSFAHL